MTNRYVISSTELYHHGIKGQRWGIRRFQKKDGTLTAKGKERYSQDDSMADEPAEKNSKKGLTDKQKKAIKVGAAIVGTALVAYGAYKVSQIYRGSGSKIDPDTGFRLLDKNMSDAEHLKAINPGRISFLSKSKNMEIINGSSSNCMLCTTAYEFRKRGFDVHAGLEKTGYGYMPDQIFPKLFKDYKGTTKFSSRDGSYRSLLTDIEKFAESQGHGSRGNTVVWWKQGGGHSVIWENINGKIVFKDGQTNKIYENFGEQILKHAKLSRPVEMLRTDNLTINSAEAKKFMNTNTLLKTYVDHGGEIAVKAANNPVGRMGLFAVGLTALSKIDSKSAVNNYRKQHPNTKMSDKQIVEMLRNQQ